MLRPNFPCPICLKPQHVGAIEGHGTLPFGRFQQGSFAGVVYQIHDQVLCRQMLDGKLHHAMDVWMHANRRAMHNQQMMGEKGWVEFVVPQRGPSTKCGGVQVISVS